MYRFFHMEYTYLWNIIVLLLFLSLNTHTFSTTSSPFVKDIFDIIYNKKSRNLNQNKIFTELLDVCLSFIWPSFEWREFDASPPQPPWSLLSCIFLMILRDKTMDNNNNANKITHFVIGGIIWWKLCTLLVNRKTNLDLINYPNFQQTDTCKTQRHPVTFISGCFTPSP